MAYEVDRDAHELAELNEIICGVPRFPSGLQSFPDMIWSYLEVLLDKIDCDFPLHMKQLSKLFFSIAQSQCSCLEVHDKIIKYFDDEPPFQLQEAFLSGSWAEGLAIYEPARFDPPDVDFMCVLKNVSFSEADQNSGGLAINDASPFVNAYLSDVEKLKEWHSFFEEPAHDALAGKICKLSSTKIKERLHKNYVKAGDFFNVCQEECSQVTGSPSLKLSRSLSRHDDFPREFAVNFFEMLVCNIWPSSDLVLAISCEGWPQNAQEWIHRPRHWPPRDIIENVCRQGFHIVAKSSEKENFRLSFSKAEGTLVANWSRRQQKVIRAFKAVIKFLIPCDPKDRNVLSSYHLKTIAFWHLERSPAESWTRKNSVDHLLGLLHELLNALRRQNLPMYFLPKYNLLESFEDKLQLENLSHQIELIVQDLPKITNAVKMGAKFHFFRDIKRFLTSLPSRIDMMNKSET